MVNAIERTGYSFRSSLTWGLAPNIGRRKARPSYRPVWYPSCHDSIPYYELPLGPYQPKGFTSAYGDHSLGGNTSHWLPWESSRKPGIAANSPLLLVSNKHCFECSTHTACVRHSIKYIIRQNETLGILGRVPYCHCILCNAHSAGLQHFKVLNKISRLIEYNASAIYIFPMRIAWNAVFLLHFSSYSTRASLRHSIRCVVRRCAISSAIRIFANENCVERRIAAAFIPHSMLQHFKALNKISRLMECNTRAIHIFANENCVCCTRTSHLSFYIR